MYVKQSHEETVLYHDVDECVFVVLFMIYYKNNVHITIYVNYICRYIIMFKSNICHWASTQPVKVLKITSEMCSVFIPVLLEVLFFPRNENSAQSM